MSELALLTGRLAAGVWQGGRLPRADLAALASGLSWDVRSGEISTTEDKAGYLDQLGQLAGVPGYTRPNWDAMADGLRDTNITTRRLLLIEPTQPSPFDAIAVEILDEATRFWRHHGATMQVVWFGLVNAPHLDDVDPERRSRA